MFYKSFTHTLVIGGKDGVLRLRGSCARSQEIVASWTPATGAQFTHPPVVGVLTDHNSLTTNGYVYTKLIQNEIKKARNCSPAFKAILLILD